MGEAKRRGSFEDRKMKAIEEDKAFEEKVKKARELINPKIKNLSSRKASLLAALIGFSISNSAQRRTFNAYFK